MEQVFKKMRRLVFSKMSTHLDNFAPASFGPKSNRLYYGHNDAVWRQKACGCSQKDKQVLRPCLVGSLRSQTIACPRDSLKISMSFQT